MINEYVDAIAQTPKEKLFGIFRTGWTEPRKVKFVKRVARILYTRGAMTTGQLAAYVATTMQDEIFDTTLTLLKEIGAITVTKRPMGSSYLAETTEERYEKFIELTNRGDFWAAETCLDEQAAGRNPRE